MKILDFLKGLKISKKIKRGNFYFFEYESKLYEEDKLEYYDKQPLVIMIGKYQGNYIGLNFHYIPPIIRKRIIKKLKRIYKRWDKNKTLNFMSWDKIRVELKYSEHMIKQYIPSNMKRPKRILNKDMEKYIEYKSEKFIGIKPMKLWRQLGIPV